ncbi:MAG: CBS domain-containing protein, partial [Bacteroidota bacterium]
MKVNVVSEEVKTFRIDDDMFDVLSYLKENSIAIVVDKDNALKGLVSQYDTTQYFRMQAEDMMLIQDIEESINDHVKASFTDEQGSPQEKKLYSAINKITNSPVLKNYKSFLNQYKNNSKQDFEIQEEIISELVSNDENQLELEDLSFDQKINLLLRSPQWDEYGINFGIDKSDLRHLLEAVRDVRNKLAHFRGEASKIEITHLQECVSLMKKFPPILAEATEDDIREPSEQEIKEQVASLDNTSEDSSISEEEIDEYESRYTPLGGYLKGHSKNADKVRLTFAQVAAIIDDDLPPSAYKHRAWWTNDRNHTQANTWLDAGWRATYLNMNNETVTFVRSKEQDQRYIYFFSEVLQELREREFNMRNDVNPNGASWIY